MKRKIIIAFALLISIFVVLGFSEPSFNLAYAKPGDDEQVNVSSEGNSGGDSGDACEGQTFPVINTDGSAEYLCVDTPEECSIYILTKDPPADHEAGFNSNSRLCYWALKRGAKDSQSTILPFTDLSVSECRSLYEQDAVNPNLFKNYLKGDGDIPTYIPDEGKEEVSVLRVDILGCGIKTGQMKLWMIPYYIRSLLQFALSLAGIIAVGAMVFGGYLYMFGSVMDDKEQGKRSVIYGIGGFVVVLLAWAIVNVVISLATM